MADPVSWFLIRPGWKVVAADGAEVGRVDEVAGDEDSDIFDGLAVATSVLGKPRYVPAEQIASIEEGTIRLSLTSDQAAQLGQYLEPESTPKEAGSARSCAGSRAASSTRRRSTPTR
jgi:hypothetical protein